MLFRDLFFEQTMCNIVLTDAAARDKATRHFFQPCAARGTISLRRSLLRAIIQPFSDHVGCRGGNELTSIALCPGNCNAAVVKSSVQKQTTASPHWVKLGRRGSP